MDELSRREASIVHAGENLVDAVLRLGDKTILGCESCIRTADQELEAGSTGAVGDTDGTSELDEITGSNKMLLEKGRQGVDSFVDTVVRREVGLDLAEDDHRPISSGALELAALRESNGVMEGETESLMDILATLPFKDLLKIVAEREEWAAL